MIFNGFSPLLAPGAGAGARGGSVALLSRNKAGFTFNPSPGPSGHTGGGERRQLQLWALLGWFLHHSVLPPRKATAGDGVQRAQSRLSPSVPQNGDAVTSRMHRALTFHCDPGVVTALVPL